MLIEELFGEIESLGVDDLRIHLGRIDDETRLLQKVLRRKLKERAVAANPAYPKGTVAVRTPGFAERHGCRQVVSAVEAAAESLDVESLRRRLAQLDGRDGAARALLRSKFRLV